jgi:PDZ domain-containing protein
MTTPKHLWSGDWEEESEAAAARRRGMDPLPEPEPGPVPERTLVSDRPPVPVDRHSSPTAPAPLRGERHPRRIPWRAVGVAAAVALVIVAGAFAADGLFSSGNDPAAAARPGWLGLKLGVLPGSAVVVTGFEPGSPARAAGMRNGDLITEVQSRPVAAPVDVRLAVDALREGDTIELGVQRGSHPYTVRVRLAGRSAQSGP